MKPWLRNGRHLRASSAVRQGARWRPITLMLAAAWALASISGTAVATDSAIAPITRTVLEHRPIPGTDQEMQLILVVFQPGVVSPLHHHPVPGLNYILEGTAESAYGSDPPRRYHAGDTLQDRSDEPHTVFRNPDPQHVLRFLIFTNLRAGQPYLLVP